MKCANKQKQTSKTNPIRVNAETYDQIRFLANKSNKSITATLAEIVNSIFNVACTFESLNLEYETCISDSTVLIAVKGKNRLKSGSFQVNDSATEKEVNSQIEKRTGKK